MKKLIIFWNKEIVFKYIWLKKFINQCVWQGKKQKIELYFYRTIKLLKETTLVPILYFYEALFILKPLILLRWIRRGRKWHQVARPVHEELQFRTGFYFLAKSFRLRYNANKKSPYLKLYEEVLNLIHDKRSKFLDFKNDIYSIALYNRSLFRFKW